MGRQVQTVKLDKEDKTIMLVRRPNITKDTTITWSLVKRGFILAYITQQYNPFFFKRMGPQTYRIQFWIAYLNDMDKTVITGKTRKSLIDYILVKENH